MALAFPLCSGAFCGAAQESAAGMWRKRAVWCPVPWPHRPLSHTWDTRCKASQLGHWQGHI